MRVLVLGWQVRGPVGRPGPQALGLAAGLGATGHDVRLVTRLGPDEDPPTVADVEVHAVTDAPPIPPGPLDGPLLAALAVAARTTSVAVRRLEERAVDVVHAEGWWTAPVVAGLRTTHGVRVVAEVAVADLTGGGPVAELAWQLVDDAVAVVARTSAAAEGLVAAGVDRELLLRLPVGCSPPSGRLGVPPAAGPVHLSVGPGGDHRDVAAALRGALTRPRRVTGSWRRRPVVAVVLGPEDVDAVARAWGSAVPVLAVDGPAGRMVAAVGAGEVVPDDTAAVAARLEALLVDGERLAALGAAAAAAARERGWDTVAASWIAGVRPRLAQPRLTAAG